LLEVLIAMGVLAVGLLGVAAVIPVARFEIVEAAKADRSAAAGQAMLGHVKASGTFYQFDASLGWTLGDHRGMLNPYTWLPAFETST
jgi:Tfp pilus assembly protein PilV